MDKKDENVREISKIKIEDAVYDIKDTELREAIDILLGKNPNSINKKNIN